MKDFYNKIEIRHGFTEHSMCVDGVFYHSTNAFVWDESLRTFTANADKFMDQFGDRTWQSKVAGEIGSIPLLGLGFVLVSARTGKGMICHLASEKLMDDGTGTSWKVYHYRPKGKRIISQANFIVIIFEKI